MHTVTLGYNPNPSKEEQQAAADFFNSLKHVIPCPICREHYTHFLSQTPVESVTSSRDKLVYWCFQLHNKVNEQLNNRTITWEQFIETMKSLRDKEEIHLTPSSSFASSAGLVIGGILLGAAGYYAFNHIVKPK